MIGKSITRTRYPVLLAGIALLLLGTAFRLGASQAQANAGRSIDPNNKWAWSTGAGWINFDPTHGGVTVYPDHLEGYAWAKNIGWIRLGAHTGGGPHHYDNTTESNYGVNVDGSGNLSGYAWSASVGWINFHPTHGRVTIDPNSGSFDGYAWSENVGWIHLKNAAAAVNRWAWSNTGWINLDPTHGGVAVYTDHMEGYAWAENIGWIRLGAHTGGGAHHYDNTTQDNYGVNNDGSGNLSGYAWSTSAGWINFDPTHGGVTVDASTGYLDGYAWSENAGWIRFIDPTYNVATDFPHRVYLPLVLSSHSPLRASFTTAPTSGVAPLTVVFTNTSSGNYTSSWNLGIISPAPGKARPTPTRRRGRTP